jgi:hypothetical protein
MRCRADLTEQRVERTIQGLSIDAVRSLSRNRFRGVMVNAGVDLFLSHHEALLARRADTERRNTYRA